MAMTSPLGRFDVKPKGRLGRGRHALSVLVKRHHVVERGHRAEIRAALVGGHRLLVAAEPVEGAAELVVKAAHLRRGPHRLLAGGRRGEAVEALEGHALHARGLVAVRRARRERVAARHPRVVRRVARAEGGFGHVAVGADRTAAVHVGLMVAQGRAALPLRPVGPTRLGLAAGGQEQERLVAVKAVLALGHVALERGAIGARGLPSGLVAGQGYGFGHGRHRLPRQQGQGGGSDLGHLRAAAVAPGGRLDALAEVGAEPVPIDRAFGVREAPCAHQEAAGEEAEAQLLVPVGGRGAGGGHELDEPIRRPRRRRHEARGGHGEQALARPVSPVKQASIMTTTSRPSPTRSFTSARLR
jgi:hypothetical protein